MNSQQILELTEAYVAVYDEDLRYDLQELNEIESELSFIDDLSNDELNYVIEDVIYEFINVGYGINEVEYLFESSIQEYEELYEGKAADLVRRGREIESRAKNIRNIRLRRSVGRAIGHAAERTKTYAGGASSAVQGGVAQAGRSISGKLKSAKEKIKGFVGRAATDVKAAPGIAKRAAERAGAKLTHHAANYAAGLTDKATKKLMKVAHKAYQHEPSVKGGSRVPTTPSASKPKPAPTPKRRDVTGTSSGSGSGGTVRSKGGPIGRSASRSGTPLLPAARKPAVSGSYSGAGVGRRERTGSSGVGAQGATRSSGGPIGRSSVRSGTPSLPASGKSGGSTKAGKPLTTSQRAMRNRKFSAEDIELLLPYIIEDFINEGYAETEDDVFDILEDLSTKDFNDIVESYLEENSETYDYYNDVLNHLLDEGYADTVESAEKIMINMSEEWLNTIINN